MATFDAHHSSGPRARFLVEQRTLPGVAKMLDIDHPDGDFSRPAVEEIALISLRSSRLSLQTDFGAGASRFTAFGGDLFLAPAGVAPTIVTYDAHRLRCAAIPVDRIRQMFNYEDRPFDPLHFGALHRRSFRSALATSLLDRMWDASGRGVGDDPFGEAALVVLAFELATLAGHRAAPLRGGLTAAEARRSVDRLMDSRAPSIIELAHAEGRSVRHFSRAFRQTTGVSPSVFRSQQRIERAKALLADTDMPIATIAEDLGYADPSYFARRFARATGCAPRDYRASKRS